MAIFLFDMASNIENSQISHRNGSPIVQNDSKVANHVLTKIYAPIESNEVSKSQPNGVAIPLTSQPIAKKRGRKPSATHKKEKLPVHDLSFSAKLLAWNQAEIVIPIKTVSEANSFEPWRTKYTRHKAQKKAVFVALLSIKHMIDLPAKITITRYAPGTLDAHDNLPISQKYITDAIAAELTNDYRPGRADNHEQFSWHFNQEKCSKYGVKIFIEWGV